MDATSRIRASGLACILALGMAGVDGNARAAEAFDPARIAVNDQVRSAGGPAAVEPDVLEVKFRDEMQVRLRNGVPTNLAGVRTEQARATLDRNASFGVWSRSMDLPEEQVERLQAQPRDNAARSDLNSYFRLRLAPGRNADEVAAELRRLPEVEAVYRVPRPARPPAVPDYYSVAGSPYQRYQDPAPDGVGARSADGFPGARGTGVALCDVEYSFDSAHADLQPVSIVGPKLVDPSNDVDHGTATLGEIVSRPDGVGTTGIAYESRAVFSPAYVHDPQRGDELNIGAAVTRCLGATQAGDVIMIEQQMYGPDQGSYVPVEWYRPTYDAIRLASRSGRIVVEAAGNGGQNLDADLFRTGNDGHHPFVQGNGSGAILVGAGQSPAFGGTARSAHDYSNYGSAVVLQGWGDHVVTTGYGHLYNADGETRWYTDDFSGTSSATPIVAGAIASVQGRNRTLHGAPLSADAIRTLLLDTGTPQTGSKHVGPLPDLRRALESLEPAVSASAATYDVHRMALR